MFTLNFVFLFLFYLTWIVTTYKSKKSQVCYLEIYREWFILIGSPTSKFV